jgi:hypothetical protein
LCANVERELRYWDVDMSGARKQIKANADECWEATNGLTGPSAVNREWKGPGILSSVATAAKNLTPMGQLRAEMNATIYNSDSKIVTFGTLLSEDVMFFCYITQLNGTLHVYTVPGPDRILFTMLSLVLAVGDDTIPAVDAPSSSVRPRALHHARTPHTSASPCVLIFSIH